MVLVGCDAGYRAHSRLIMTPVDIMVRITYVRKGAERGVTACESQGCDRASA